MGSFFNFIKKTDKNSNTNQQAGQQQSNQQPNQQTTVQQTTQQVSGRTQSYSGVGAPPGEQAAYSGIGQPPSPQAPQQTTQTQVVKNTPSDSQKQDNQKQDSQQKDSEKQQNSKIDNKDKENGKQDDKKVKQELGTSLKSNMDKKKQGNIDLMTHLTQRSNRVFLSTQTKAKELHSQYVDTEHLLHGLLSDSEIYNLITDLKVQPQIIEEELNKIYKREKFNEIPQLSPRVKRILDNSLVIARKLGFEFISPEHILLALFDEGEGVAARILTKMGLKKEDLNKKVIGKKEGLEKQEEKEKEKANVLEQYTINMTAKAAQGQLDPVVERSKVIERVIHILSRRNKNNPALVGEAGVGKTAIVEGLAQQIVSKKVPEPLLNKRILSLDLMAVLAGASHRGEFEERMKNVIEEIKKSNGEIILFIDEIHNIMGAGGGEGSSDAANFLKPALSRGEMQLIGATTLTEYRKHIEKDPALERRFQPIIVPEPTVEQAVKMLKATKDKYEAFHRVKIPDDVVEAAVKYSKRYVGDRFLPDKAVDLIDEAASAVRLPLISLPEEILSIQTHVAELNQELQESEKKGDKVRARIIRSKLDDVQAELNEKKEEYNTKKGQTTSVVTVEIIKDIVSKWTGVPVSKITGSEMEKLINLEKIMHKRLINQEEAVSVVSQAIRRGRAGLKSKVRPIGSFVFLGPTGVGKTELAKTLADILFGQEEAMIRFDMTEYMEKHEVAKLLGAPPGYVGYEEGGKLTEVVRRRPYSVVLFDEVEKAHPDIFNILLQILDDGRLTDNKGRLISFKNTVVICTSNIGSKIIHQELLKGAREGEIEEPSVLSTYTFSPRGREIITIGNKSFEKQEKGTWDEKILLDYFAGQEVVEDKDVNQENEKTEFPIHGFDTHAISSQGIEVITKENKMFFRKSTTSKTWESTTLIKYYKGNMVINALPDAPDEQLPTAALKTHAFSPDEKEIVTFKDRFWRRKQNSTDWETGFLKDYFVDQKIEKGNFPTTYWDIHTFSPNGTEIVIVGENIWYKTKDAGWQAKSIEEYFGKDFPLKKQTDEKEKIDKEISKKRYEQMKKKVMEELHKFFRPELINRFDEITVFESLRYVHMKEIVKLQLKSVQKAMEDQDMGFVCTEQATKEVVRQGFDPIFGARPLRRAIQRLIENPISSLIIEKKVIAGDQVVVDFDGEGFIFNIEKVELVDVSKAQKQKIQSFFCEACGNRFKTEVVQNATAICPKCVSNRVQEIAEEKSEELNTDKNMKTDTMEINKDENKQKPKDNSDTNKEGNTENNNSEKPESDENIKNVDEGGNINNREIDEESQGGVQMQKQN